MRNLWASVPNAAWHSKALVVNNGAIYTCINLC